MAKGAFYKVEPLVEPKKDRFISRSAGKLGSSYFGSNISKQLVKKHAHMKKFTALLGFFLGLGLSLIQAQSTDVMLQGFNWESHTHTSGWYNIIKSKAADLQDAQIDLVWFPPVSDAAAPQGYLPRELYKLDSEYGTQAELVSAISELNAYGVKAVADIVINHRVGTTNWADFTNPTWGCWSITANDEWGQNGGNPCGGYDTGDNYGPARDIDHTNSTVQAEISSWMNWLKNTIGFDGWRYDYVRGYSGYYNYVYNSATNPDFSVGELWDNLDLNNTNPHRQQLIDWVDATQSSSNAFDFTTKGILQQAVNGELWRLSQNGGAPGMIGWWPQRSVTFIDNHDTGSTQAHWPFPGDKVMQGYAYILTHPGIPSVFWDHFYDWGLHDDIKDLIAIRKDNGINSGSNLDIKAAQWDLYAAEIDGVVAMKIGPGSWSPSGTGWTLRASGTNYAVWEKAASSESLTIHLKKPSNWSNATMYYWNLTPSGSNASWPGGTMQPEGDGWYVLTLNGPNCANLIFSDGGANQSVDLYRCGEGWYDGTWHNTQPQGQGGTTDLVVHFRPSTYTNPSIYFWNVDSGASTTWPGVAMQDDGGGWFSHTFAGAQCADFIFSNNGSNQTPDLNSCSEFWYENPAYRQGAETSSAASTAPAVLAWEHYPNPTNGAVQLRLELQRASPISIEVIDHSGRPVAELWRGSLRAGEHRMGLEVNLPAGYYWYRLRSAAQVEYQPVVIIR